MATLNTAHNQWANRPDDQRFTSLESLHAFTSGQRAIAHASVTSSRRLKVAPHGADNGLAVIGGQGVPAALTNWAFGQLTARAGAPAGYLRKLPAPMAADCLNFGLNVARESEDIGILVQRPHNDAPAILRAATGPEYGRVWNADVTGALLDRFGGSDWTVPGVMGRPLETVTKQNTTLYASDRDMFVFLADEKNRITVPNRRNGAPGEVSRGFFVWNSETGSGTLGLAAFFFDWVCENRYVWGATGYQEIRVRHTASAPDKFIEQVAPALEHYAQSSSGGLLAAIAAAKDARIKSDIAEFLAQRFTGAETRGIMQAHMIEEDRPIETLWDAAQGVTAYAKTIAYADARVALERSAGKILDLATA